MSREAEAAQLEQAAQRRAELVGGRASARSRSASARRSRRRARRRSASACCRRRRRGARAGLSRRRTGSAAAGPRGARPRRAAAPRARRRGARPAGVASSKSSSSSGISTKRRASTCSCGQRAAARERCSSSPSSSTSTSIGRGPWRDAAGRAAELALERLAGVEQLARARARSRSRRQALRNAAGRGSRRPGRCRRSTRTRARVTPCAAEAVDRRLQVGAAVADVGAQAEVADRRAHQLALSPSAGKSIDAATLSSMPIAKNCLQLGARSRPTGAPTSSTSCGSPRARPRGSRGPSTPRRAASGSAAARGRRASRGRRCPSTRAARPASSPTAAACEGLLDAAGSRAARRR